jgi:hypothetical protein
VTVLFHITHVAEEGDISETVESCLQHLTDISEKGFRLLVPMYGMVFEEIQQRLDQDLEEDKYG